MTEAQAALQAIKLYQTARGVRPESFKHTPLHYHVADLVTGLLKLSNDEGLDWTTVVRDAKECLEPLPAAPKRSTGRRSR